MASVKVVAAKRNVVAHFLLDFGYLRLEERREALVAELSAHRAVLSRSAAARGWDRSGQDAGPWSRIGTLRLVARTLTLGYHRTGLR